jgi:hypothetical protein
MSRSSKFIALWPGYSSKIKARERHSVEPPRAALIQWATIQADDRQATLSAQSSGGRASGPRSHDCNVES